jgi:hypothetical protein
MSLEDQNHPDGSHYFMQLTHRESYSESTHRRGLDLETEDVHEKWNRTYRVVIYTLRN